MRVLLTGATGFVGSHLGADLAARGYEVIAVSRDPKKAQEGGFSFAHEVVTWATLNHVSGVDAVIHLAGDSVAESRWTPEKKQRILGSRINTTAQLVDFVRKAEKKPKVLISTSAVGFYGDRGEELLTEDMAAGNDFLANVCAKWEREASQAMELGVRTVIFRFGMVLGAGGGALAKVFPLFKTGLGGRLGNGSQWMSWIHLSDVVRIHCFALERDMVAGTYNAVAPQAVRNKHFTKALGAALKRPTFFSVPKFILKLALGEMSSILLASQRADSAKIASHGFSFDFVNIEPALEEIAQSSLAEI